MLRLPVLSSFLLCGLVAYAVNVVYDEFLWTKEIWPVAKFDNPLRHTNPSDLEPKLLEVYPSIKGSRANSLDGPEDVRDGSEGLMEDSE